MENSEKKDFRRKWDNYLKKRFCYHIENKQKNLKVMYPFDFCSFSSDFKFDKEGRFFLYFIYSKTEGRESGNNATLINIVKDFFTVFSNDDYIGYYNSRLSADLVDILRAIFLLGNPIEDIDLRDFMFDPKTKFYYDKFLLRNLSPDELFDKFVDDVIEEFEIIVSKLKGKIFANKSLKDNNEQAFKFYEHFIVQRE